MVRRSSRNAEDQRIHDGLGNKVPLPLIDLRTQESEGSGGERQKLVCSGRRTKERYRVDGPTDDTVTGSRDETVKQTQLTRSSRK